MKRTIKYLIFTILMLFTVKSAVSADNHLFSFKAYNCNAINDDLECIDDDEEVLDLDDILIGSNGMVTVGAGKLIRLDVWYQPSTTDPDTMMQLGYTYDPDVVEPLVDEDTGELIMPEAQPPYYGGIYPPKADTGTNSRKTNWEIAANNVVNKHKIKMMIEDGAMTQAALRPLTNTGSLATVFFKVKANLEPGTPLPFEYIGEDTLMSNKSGVETTDIELSTYHEADNDASLSGITVSNGNVDYPLATTFNPTTKTYTVYVPNDVTTVTVTGTPTKNTTSVLVDTVGTLNVSQNTGVNLFTTAEGGATDTYTVNIYRLNNVATLSALTLSDVNFGTFSSGTTTYTANVAYSVSSTTVSATATDATNATVTGTGEQALSVGDTDVSVVVSPENCKAEYSGVPGNTCQTQTYTVTVTRAAASTNANLTDLKIDGVTVTGFDPTTLTYNVDAASNKNSITIAATAEDSNANVSGLGEKSITTGNNEFDIVVTAEDGTTQQTYHVTVRKLSNVATLSSLTATSNPQGTMDKTFNANTETYTYTVARGVTEVTIAATATDSTNAQVTGTGVYNLATQNKVEVTVTAEDGTTTKTYTINFATAQSDNANLSAIGVTGYTLNEDFDADTTNYTLSVASDVENVTLTATAEDDPYATVDGTGVKVLGFGANPFDVTVTAEDGHTTKVYHVVITRAFKNNAKLSDLKVNGTTVSGFDPDEPLYVLSDVNGDVSSITITATAADGDATVSGTGQKQLTVGSNGFDITVTAQDQVTTSTYRIEVKKLNNVATLSSLTATSNPQGTMDKNFNANTETYTYTVARGVTEVTIAATASDENAQVTGTGVYNLASQNKAEVTVTSEDGQVSKTYTVNFATAQSDNADLSALGVTGYALNEGFNAGTTNYTLTVPSDVENITITATADDEPYANVSGTGNKTLGYGANPFDVTVTAEDGHTSKVYHLVVTRSLKNNAKLSDLKVNGTTVTGFSPDEPLYVLADADKDVTSITIAATAADSDASVSGTGSKTLTIGPNGFDITVTAQDQVTTSTYRIEILKLNNDTALQDLTATSNPQGTFNTNFNPNTKEYTFTVDKSVTQVTIAATPHDENASVTGTGVYNLATQTKADLLVTAADGSTDVYTVNFAKAKSDNADLSAIGVTGYNLNEDFNANRTNYTLTVPSDVENVTLTATPADGDATVSGIGNKTLEFGANPFDITVTAEDGTTTKTYHIVVTRSLKNNAKLSDLKVNGTTVTGFSPDEPLYVLSDVNGDVDTITISATAADGDATVSGTGEKELTVGPNGFDITVTAHDGVTTGTYRIEVKKLNNVATLSSLTATSNPQGTMDKNFNANTETYTYTVDKSVTQVTINATATDSENANVTGTGVYNLATQNKAEITVTSEDGQVSKTYTVNFVKAKSNNADLSSIGVTGYNLNEDFNAERTNYTLTVPTDVENVTLTATAADGDATVSGTGDKTLGYGANPFDIIVTAEDENTTKTYHVVITRTLSADAKLSDLKVNGTTIAGFDPDEPLYILSDVNGDVDTITISATAADPQASVSGTGEKELTVGTNGFDITVTAQDQVTTSTYRIEVKKLNNDATLKSLTATSNPQGTMDKNFNASTETYTYTVDKSVTQVTIAATATDTENANVTGTGVYNLATQNKAEITVTSEDGQVSKTYTVNFVKAKSNNADLSSIGVEGYTLNEDFNADRTNYTLTVPYDVDSVTLTATAEDTDANIAGTGVKSLTELTNPFDITVTAEDGETTKTYTITISKQLKTNANLTDLKVDNVSVPNFNADTLKYYLDPVVYDTETVNITATVADSDAIVEGDGIRELTLGDNELEVTVRAQDRNVTKTYKIYITRQNNDTRLSSLTVTSNPQGVLDRAFDATIKEYTYTVDKSVTSVNVAATAVDSNADVSGTGDYDLAAQNKADITVTAEDGTTDVYTVNFVKASSDNANLSAIGVEGYTLNESFGADTLQYTLTVPADTETVTLTATAADSDADVTGTGVKSLPNDTNSFDITVTAEDGHTTKTYTITITKESTDPQISDKITSDEYGHVIQNGMIRSVVYKSTPTQLKNQLDNTPKSNLHVYKLSDITNHNSELVAVGDDEKLATGMIIKLIINGVEKDSKKLVVKGDVDGNGVVALLDAINAIKAYLDNITLEGEWYDAADFDSNGQIALLDAINIIKVYLQN